MSTFKCALMGFPPSDVMSFMTFFRLTATLGVSFSHTPVESDADILIVDASDRDAVRKICQPGFGAKALFVGDAAPTPQWPVVSRPFRLTKVLQVLQDLAGDNSKPTPNLAAAARPVPQRPARGATALVIDDSPIAQKATCMKLERFGLEVTIAASGEEALVLLLEHEFSIVFIDVMMDGLDGYQTCKLIKQRRYAGPSPVAVMLTSRGGTLDKIRGSLAGCDAYLTKPVEEQELIRVLLKHQLISQTAAPASH